MSKKVYRTTVYDGIKANGKQKTITLRADSKRELDRLVREHKDNRYKGLDDRKGNTFGRWANTWFKNKQISKSKSDSACNIYILAIKLLKTRFNDIELKDIKLADFENFLIDISETKYVFEPRKIDPLEDINNFNVVETIKRTKPLSKSYIKKVVHTAEKIFQYAIDNGVVALYFFKSVSIPVDAVDHKRRALTEQEQRMIIETPHRCQLSAMIMLFSGLRRGELLALKWSDIDFEKGQMHVQRALNVKTKEENKGKTDNAQRNINMPPILINFLMEYNASQKVKNINDYVCVDCNGKQFSETGFRRMWSSYLLDLNVKYGYPDFKMSKYMPGGLPMRIEPFTPHYLRHTYATLLYLQNISTVDAMKYMGHANYDTTVDVYTDLKTLDRCNLSEWYKEMLNTEFKIA